MRVLLFPLVLQMSCVCIMPVRDSLSGFMILLSGLACSRVGLLVCQCLSTNLVPGAPLPSPSLCSACFMGQLFESEEMVKGKC